MLIKEEKEKNRTTPATKKAKKGIKQTHILAWNSLCGIQNVLSFASCDTVS